MKVTCDKCGAGYDIQDERIPEEGMTMKCPKCLVSFRVKKDGDDKGSPGLDKSRTILGIGIQKKGLLDSLTKMQNKKKPDDEKKPAGSVGAIVTPAKKDAGAPSKVSGPTTLPGVGSGRAAESEDDEFFVKRYTGRVFGPFPVSSISKMLREGKLEGNEEISEDKESWRSLESHSLLREAKSGKVAHEVQKEKMEAMPDLPALKKKREESVPELPTLKKREDSAPDLPKLKTKKDSAPELPTVKKREQSAPELPTLKKREESAPDLPALKTKKDSAPELPTAKKRRESAPELPTAKKQKEAVPDLPTPKKDMTGKAPVSGAERADRDLPAPKVARGAAAGAEEDLPVSKGEAIDGTQGGGDEGDFPVARESSPSVSSTPMEDDLLQAKGGPKEDVAGGGAGGLDLSDLDLVEPKTESSGREDESGVRELDFSSEGEEVGESGGAEDPGFSLDQDLGATPIDLDELDVVMPSSKGAPSDVTEGTSAKREPSAQISTEIQPPPKGVESVKDTRGWFEKNKALVLGGVVVCLLVAVGVLVYKFVFAQEEKPGTARRTVTKKTTEPEKDVKVLILEELREDTVAGYEKAVAKAKKTASENKSSISTAVWAKAVYCLAVRYGIRVDDYKKVRAAFSKVVKSGEKHVEISKASALRDLYNKKAKKAGSVLSKMCEKEADLEACVFLGWAELERGRLKSARKAFKKALEKNEDYPAPLFGMGVAYVRSGLVEKGLPWLSKVVKVSPNHLEAKLVKSLIKLREKRDGVFQEKEHAELKKQLEKLIKPAEKSKSKTLNALAAGIWGLFLELSGERDESLTLLNDKTAKSRDPLVAAEHAWGLFRSGRFEECVKRIKKVKRRARGSLYLVHGEVECMLAMGQGDKALSVVRKVYKLHEKEPFLRVLRGRVNLVRKKPDSAEKYYKKALEIDPRYVPAYDAWIRLKIRDKKELPGAHAQIEQLGVQGIKDPRITFLRGDIFVGQNRWEDAEAAYKQALEERPFENRYKVALAEAYMGADKLNETQVVLKEIWSKAKSQEGVAILLAHYHKRSRDMEEAVKVLEKGVESRPTVTVKLALARYRLKRGDKKSIKMALDFLLKLVKEKRLDYRVNKMVGKAFLGVGNFTEAETYLKRALAIESKDVEGRLLMAKAYMGQGNTNRAVNELKEALEVDPEAVDVLEYRARIAFSRGAVLAAIEDLDKILKTKPSASAYTLKAECLLERRETKKARNALQKALDLDPRHPRAHFVLGRELYRSGKLKASVKSLRRALTVLEEQDAIWVPDAHYMLGQAFLQLRDSRQAKKHLETFLKLTKNDKARQTRRKDAQRKLRQLGG